MKNQEAKLQRREDIIVVLLFVFMLILLFGGGVFLKSYQRVCLEEVVYEDQIECRRVMMARRCAPKRECLRWEK